MIKTWEILSQAYVSERTTIILMRRKISLSSTIIDLSSSPPIATQHGITLLRRSHKLSDLDHFINNSNGSGHHQPHYIDQSHSQSPHVTLMIFMLSDTFSSEFIAFLFICHAHILLFTSSSNKMKTMGLFAVTLHVFVAMKISRCFILLRISC